jgi:hypothetical protein
VAIPFIHSQVLEYWLAHILRQQLNIWLWLAALAAVGAMAAAAAAAAAYLSALNHIRLGRHIQSLLVLAVQTKRTAAILSLALRHLLVAALAVVKIVLHSMVALAVAVAVLVLEQHLVEMVFLLAGQPGRVSPAAMVP